MAEFKFFCPSCGQHILCDTGHSGMQINCPACQHPIVVPQAPAAAMPATPPPPAPVYALHQNPTSAASQRQYPVTPVAQPAVPIQSRALRTVLIILIAVLALAGLGVGGWFGYTKIRFFSQGGHLPAGLVALWSGEGNANDSVGACNGQPIKGVAYAPGKVGQAFSFNGDNNIVIPDQPSLNPTTGITISCWAYSRRNSPMYGQVLVSKDGICRVGRQYLLVWGGGNDAPGGIRVHVGVPSGMEYFEGTTVLQNNTWYHAVMTYDGATLKVYVNGKLDGQKAVTGPIITTPEPVRIGGGAEDGCYQGYFDGMIDEPAIYNRALSAEEIQRIYQRQK